MTKRTFREAMFDGIREEMEADSSVIHLSLSAPPPLATAFGEERVRTSPIAEPSLTGISVGAAGSGYRPIVGWGNSSFSFLAMDQVVNQAAHIRYMFGGQRSFPIVFYASFYSGTRSAAQHSQSNFTYFAHAAGLKVVAPATPADAKGLMKAAIRDNNPVVFLYSDMLSAMEDEVPDEDVITPFETARTLREGSDITLVGVGRMALVAREAADRLAADQNVSAEVIDPRTVVPLDMESIRASVRRTGRLVAVDESFPTCSVASEIQAVVAEDADTFAALRGPVRRVCTAPVPIPFSPVLEDYVVPDVSDVCTSVLNLMERSS